MIPFKDKLTGTDCYSYSTKSCDCDVEQCSAPAVYQLRMGGHTAELQYYCEAHLETKEFVLSGQCDNCLKKKNFEKWLSLTRAKAQSNHLFKLCFACSPTQGEVK